MRMREINDEILFLIKIFENIDKLKHDRHLVAAFFAPSKNLINVSMQKFTARLFYQRQMLKIALYHFHFSYVNKSRIDSLIIGTMPET